MLIFVIQCYVILLLQNELNAEVPIVLTTWNFTSATKEAWSVIERSYFNSIDNGLDALVAGCTACEIEQCDNTVGYGGSPDENGETTLDALIFDGVKMDMGAIGGIRRVKNVISVARHVLENTEHSLLVGDLATEFAKKFYYKEEPLSTNYSKQVWRNWENNKCQPNFWKNVYPNPKETCGPYEPVTSNEIPKEKPKFSSKNHDTIGMIVIDKNINIYAGTSTNGANHKIPGRVGDSPIPGAGAYADNDVGAAVATGDGDIMMRFLPSFLAVEEMRRGSSPKEAAKVAISRIAKKYPNFFGGVVAVNRFGIFAAACNGMDSFPFSVAVLSSSPIVKVHNVSCKP